MCESYPMGFGPVIVISDRIGKVAQQLLMNRNFWLIFGYISCITYFQKKLETFDKEELDTMVINFIILNVEQTVLKKAHWFMQLINIIVVFNVLYSKF